MSKQEDNQFIRMLFVIVYGTIIGTIGYLAKGATTSELITFTLVACILGCAILLIIFAKKHKENSDNIEDWEEKNIMELIAVGCLVLLIAVMYFGVAKYVLWFKM